LRVILARARRRPVVARPVLRKATGKCPLS